MTSSVLSRILLASMLALPFALPTPLRADPLSDAVNTLRPSIFRVSVTGSWTIDDRKGVYRIVIARTAAAQPTARLFVQWIAVAADGSQSIERSVEITELIDLKLDIADFTTETDPDGLSVFVQTIDRAQGMEQSYELFLEQDGTYRFGTASN